MARINPNEMDNYGSSTESEWLKLQDDGDIARVQFLYSSYDELDTFACHTIETGEYYSNGNPKTRYVDCKRNYDDPIDDCPFCAAGMAVKPVMILSMYDLNDKKVKIWERGKSFRKVMESKFNRYPNLCNTVFEIERHGKKGDNKTSYELIAMPEVEPVDVSNIDRPEFIGSFILDKTPDEMMAYLNTGKFPSENSSEPVRRRSSNEEPVARSRRG